MKFTGLCTDVPFCLLNDIYDQGQVEAACVHGSHYTASGSLQVFSVVHMLCMCETADAHFTMTKANAWQVRSQRTNYTVYVDM